RRLGGAAGGEGSGGGARRGNSACWPIAGEPGIRPISSSRRRATGGTCRGDGTEGRAGGPGNASGPRTSFLVQAGPPVRPKYLPVGPSPGVGPDPGGRGPGRSVPGPGSARRGP